MMIAEEILFKVRNGICAIGYLTVPFQSYLNDPQSPYFKVVGTGFMVRETTIMTNRHVIEGLVDSQHEFGFPDDQRVIVFVAPRSENRIQIVIRKIREPISLTESLLDVGFIEFSIGDKDQFEAISPLSIQDNWLLTVTEPIAVYGYPYGHSMLQRDNRVYRWGPVVQQGYISAVSPFDTISIPDEILLDVRVADGMSGAPIFRPRDGSVIGILHSGWEATTAQGLPLTKQRILEWLRNYDDARSLDASED